MGLFGGRKSKEALPEEVELYLPAKEVQRLKSAVFTKGVHTPARELWMLGFAAPLLGKDGQKVDVFPRYEGRAFSRMQAMYRKNWGDASRENLLEQVRELETNGQRERLDLLYQILRTNPPEHWGDMASRLPDYTSAQLEKLRGMEKVFELLAAYEIALPSETLYAFDLARAANLIAVGCGLGYLPKEEVAAELEKIAAASLRCYSSWSDYYGGYIIGRSLWAWSIGQYVLMDAPAVRNVCRILLKASESPYQKITLTYGADSWVSDD